MEGIVAGFAVSDWADACDLKVDIGGVLMLNAGPDLSDILISMFGGPDWSVRDIGIVPHHCTCGVVKVRVRSGRQPSLTR